MNGLIFDYGGTLDTNGVHWFFMFKEAYLACRIDIDEGVLRSVYVQTERALEQGKHIWPADSFYSVLQKKTAFHKLFLKETYSIDISQDKLNSVTNYCYMRVKNNIERITVPVLDICAQQARLVLVSNFYGNLETVLSEFGLKKYFYSIVESAQVGIRKPDTGIFKIGARSFPPSVNPVVVGDSYKNDIAPALSLGMRAVWLKVDGYQWNETENVETPYPHRISTLSEIVDLLPQLLESK